MRTTTNYNEEGSENAQLQYKIPRTDLPAFETFFKNIM